MTTYAVKNLSHGRELIAFRIGDQEFCVNIMSVREIRGWTPATSMPHAPPYVLGIINLRGAVLPIVDLSLRLGMKPAEPTVRHVIIVAQVGPKVVGLLVDAVSDILTVTEGLIQPPPEVGSPESTAYVSGVMTTDTGIVSLLSLDHILPPDIAAAA